MLDLFDYLINQNKIVECNGKILSKVYEVQYKAIVLLFEEEEASKPTQTSQTQDWGVWREVKASMAYGKEFNTYGSSNGIRLASRK